MSEKCNTILVYDKSGFTRAIKVTGSQSNRINES